MNSGSRSACATHAAKRFLLTGQGVVIAEKLHSGLEKGTALAARAEAEALSLAILHTGRFPSARARLFELRSEDRTEDSQLLAAMALAAHASAEPIDVATDLCRRSLADGIRSFDLTGADARFAAAGYAQVSLSLAEQFDEADEFLTRVDRRGEPRRGAGRATRLEAASDPTSTIAAGESPRPRPTPVAR